MQPTLPVPVTTAGDAFNYALWVPGSQITMINVPWNADYRDVVRFDNQAALDAYINESASVLGAAITITGMTQLRFGHPIQIDVPFTKALRFNYLRATNPAMPITGDAANSFYYFITGVDYVNPQTTRLTVQLDVWQTFGYTAQFGNCYIERGHIGIANTNQFDDYGREFLTIPEGLDVGGEYSIVKQYRQTIASARNVDTGSANNSYAIMVVATQDLTVDPGDVDAPNLVTASGNFMSNLPNGAAVYVFDHLDAFKGFMAHFADTPWMSQSIISITAIPPLERYNMQRSAVSGHSMVFQVPDAGSLDTKKVPMADEWRGTIPLGSRYAHLKKFLTYPYCVMELTSYTGTPLLIKPESWADPDATVVEVPHLAPPSARIVFYPYRYNAEGVAEVTDESGTMIDGGEFLDMATGIQNFPTFSLVNNGYMGYLASNANSIAFQHSSADWSQQRALSGNDLAYDQATAGIGLNTNLTGLQMGAANDTTRLANETAGWNAIQQGASHGLAAGGAGRMLSGGAGGAAAGAAGAIANAAASFAIQTNQNNQSLGIQNRLRGGSMAYQNDNSAYMRDTNKSYADYAAKGDYQNTIAGINARVQDAKLIQPTTSGQMGGDAFNLAMYKWGYDLKVKMLQPAAMRSIGEYWLRYGYAINTFSTLPESLMVMSKFTYWKLRETYIKSAHCPEVYKQALRGIFEKGVTVWKNPADIGVIDIADNVPLEGITL